MAPTEAVPEHRPSFDSSLPTHGSANGLNGTIPKHVRHISKGGSGDYTRDPSLVLKRDAEKAIGMLKKLAAEPDNEGSPRASKQALIPLDYLKRCKGIQFVFTKLGGLFVSVERGHSFTIQRLGTDHTGLPLWSGPCFGTVSQVGLGLTAGFDALDTVVILSNEATVNKLKTANAKFGVDIDLIVGRDSTLAQTVDTWTEDQAAAIPFSLGGGALLDVSFKGGAHTVNDRKNQGIYGPDATPEGILSGQVSPPPEFLPLYELINQLAAAANEGFEAEHETRAAPAAVQETSQV